MSGRNNRIVRNRERNSNGFELNSNNIKIIASVVAIILIIIIAIIVVVFKVTNKKDIVQVSELDKNNIYEYFLLSSGDNVGVIDKNGEQIIDTKYVNLYIPNPSKDVFVCYTSDDEYEILNKNEKKIFTDYEEVSAIETSSENLEVEKYVMKYKSNGLYGLIDLDGNIITEAEYDEISSVKDKPGNILVKKDNKYGVLDSKGNVVVEVKYDGVSADGYCSVDDLYTKTGYIVSEKSDDGVNFGYIDYKGNILLDIKYESVERALEYDEDDIYLIVMQKGKKGVFKNKKKIIDFNFQDINYSDLSNIFIVEKNGKYGFYKIDGKTILKPQYTKYSVAGNYISVEKDDKTQLYDVNGNLVDSSSYTKMNETENPAYFIAEDENGYYSIISKDVKIDEKYIQVSYAFDNYFIFTDESGKSGVVNALTKEVEIEPAYDFIIVIEGAKALQAIDGIGNLIDIYSKDLEKTVTMEDGIVNSLEDGYAIVYSETDMKYINSDGNVIENTEVYPDKKLYAIQKDGKWGFADSSKKIVIECEYDIVTEFNKYGFAGIKKDGKWGVVNEDGKIIVEPTYELDTYYFPQFIGKYILIQSEITYCEEI